jgi:hypothetical protein
MVSDEVGRYHCRAEPGPLAALVERGKDLGLAIAVRSGCCVVKKGLSFICGWGGGGVIVQSDRPRPPPRQDYGRISRTCCQASATMHGQTTRLLRLLAAGWEPLGV